MDSLPRDKVVGTTLAGKAREGGDGDEVCMDSDVLFNYLDKQSRDLRDFLRFARL